MQSVFWNNESSLKGRLKGFRPRKRFFGEELSNVVFIRVSDFLFKVKYKDIKTTSTEVALVSFLNLSDSQVIILKAIQFFVEIPLYLVSVVCRYLRKAISYCFGNVQWLKLLSSYN